MTITRVVIGAVEGKQSTKGGNSNHRLTKLYYIHKLPILRNETNVQKNTSPPVLLLCSSLPWNRNPNFLNCFLCLYAPELDRIAFGISGAFLSYSFHLMQEVECADCLQG
jgi:hypothetical protein